MHPAGALYPGKKPASLTLGESRKRARTRARGVSFSLITEVVPNRGFLKVFVPRGGLEEDPQAPPPLERP